ncbi:TPA: fimbrial protein [Serratia marcescens]|nr:fimbrial protein [Serratia marcescens]HAT4976647.1 fimbrial protein [Serratia marcescens]HAT4990633.1 fimbrial protein [Serratia marcescens]HAT5049272.1 fimbrial protein [Serratia marcescens]HEJ7079748.1 fimbrial protein [Serratia marcescens]
MQSGPIAMLLLSALTLFHMPLWAVVETDMQFRGFLRAPPPCSINDGGMVDVDFGLRVGVNKIDGNNYRQAVNYRIRCEAPDAVPWETVLTLKGAAAGFDKAAVLTDNVNLGIRVYQNGVPFPPNSGIKIDPGNPPLLEAVPVAKPGEKLKEGAFLATATLQVEYQ